MQRVGVSDEACGGRQGIRRRRHESSAETTRQAVRVELIVTHELVDAVYERAVVEHVVGVDRVRDAVVVELALVHEREREVVRRCAAFAQQKQTVQAARRRRRRRGPRRRRRIVR